MLGFFIKKKLYLYPPNLISLIIYLIYDFFFKTIEVSIWLKTKTTQFKLMHIHLLVLLSPFLLFNPLVILINN